MPSNLYSKKVLKNGLTIITVPKTESTTATVLVLVKTGSKYETKDINGISHFLEHMCFKGTKRRPRAIDISSELDSLGALYNAGTSHEYTGYYAKVSPIYLGKAIDIVSDIYINQVFRQNEIKKEAGVITEEINMYEDEPRRKIYDNFMYLLYGNQPAGRGILGTKEVIRKIGARELRKYHNDHYVAEATTVVVAGPFSKDKIVKEIEKRFSSINKSKKKDKLSVKEEQKKPQVNIEYRSTDQTHMVIGFRTFPINDKRVATLRVMSTILGEGMSSRLFELIRGKLGAAYYVSSFVDLYTDHGYLGVATGVGNDRSKEVLTAILKEFEKFKTKKVKQKELKKAKDYMIGKLSLSLETTDEQAWFLGSRHVLENKITAPEDIIKEIKSVTPEKIQKLAKEVIINKGLNLAVMGPLKAKDEFVSILSI